MSSLRRTPLYDWHVAHGARLVPFAGWEMPVQYSGILEEHRAVRERAGLFDVSHMGEAGVEGPGAESALNAALTNDLTALRPGKAQYHLLCQPDGGVLDDLIVYRLAADRFLLCLNASNTARDVACLRERLPQAGVCLEDQSDRWAQLALQGPAAPAILQPLTGLPLAELPRMGHAWAEVAGIPEVLLARTGYTGEDGFELYLPPAAAPALADALLAAGQPHGLRPCGLGARDSLRLEAGLPLYGHELSETITPLQAGLGWAVKLQKACDFPGKAALTAEKRDGSPRRVLFFKLDDRRIARAGAEVWSGPTAVGRVLSGTLSPILNQPIGSALVESGADPAGLAVDIRGSRVPLRVARPPLHRAG